MPDGLRLALTTLTVARVRGPRTLDATTARQAMEIAPLIGIGLGLLAGGIAFLVRWGQGTDLLAAAVAVSALALLTRGLHLDGLADLADGLGSYRDPEGTRAVMKAPDTGALGVATLVLVLITQVTALSACYDHGRGTASLVLAVTAGRIAVTAACVGTPAATTSGLGALVAGTVRRRVTAAWIAAAAVLFSAYAIVDPDGQGSAHRAAARAVLALAVGLLVARVLRRHAVRRVGGLTGDVLGALSEITVTVALVVLALGKT